ncbi:MAG: T9SS type A sorting domain-containing protein [Bacteroidia bacterium]|nr:T9SS type A sorting domain-containing protein [Bacteroidia bacterium]
MNLKKYTTKKSTKTILLLLSVFIVAEQKINAQNFTPQSIDTLSNYLYSLQYSDNTLPSYGGVKKNKGLAIIGGQNYCSVEPYFNHIAAIGILKSNHPDKCGFAKRWMNWYLNHLDFQGKTLNHFYKQDGTGESTCPPGGTGFFCNHIDAEDSDLALFWILAYDYYTNSNDLAFFTPAVKTKLETAAKFMMDSLIFSDNLSVPMRSYPIKYTMDNSEVYQGLLRLSKIESLIYNDTAKSSLYLSKANAVKTAIRTLLYNNAAGLYDFYLGSAVDSTQWYNSGIVASLWPQLFGVDSLSDARSIHHRNVLHNNFDGTPNTNWTTPAFLGTVDAFTWASIGYLFSLAGDTAKGFAQANYISNVFVSPFPSTPCYVADAGWAIMNMALKYPATSSCALTTEIKGYEANKEAITIYPNPVKDKLFLSFNNNLITDVSLKIFDELGREVLKFKLLNNYQTTTIDISQFTPGFYYINASSDDNSIMYNRKFIVTK